MKRWQAAFRRSFLCALLPLVPVVLGSLLIANCSSMDNAYFQPSAYEAFDFDNTSEFESYVIHTRQQLMKHRIFYDPQKIDQELNHVAPYIIEPPTPCEGQRVGEALKGVILIHGFLDSAFSLKDIANNLSSSCTLIYGLLLPGHGTRPGDLLNVNQEEWLQTLRFAIRSMETKTKDITLIGYSLGGALSTVIAGEKHDSISRLVLLAPALEIQSSALLAQSVWMRWIKDWWTRFEHFYPVRYQSMTLQSLSQVYLISKKAQKTLNQNDGLTLPVLMILSEDDGTIVSSSAFKMFKTSMRNPQSRALIYKQKRDKSDDDYILDHSPNTPSRDVHLRYVYDQESQIYNFSHVALPYAPDNPVFGIAGSHRACGQHFPSFTKEQIAHCFTTRKTWKGEFSSGAPAKYAPFERLFHNPDFSQMIKTMREFIDST